MSTKPTCKKHPLYKGLRPPMNCTTCWKIYAAKHPVNATAIIYCGVHTS